MFNCMKSKLTQAAMQFAHIETIVYNGTAEFQFGFSQYNIDLVTSVSLFRLLP